MPRQRIDFDGVVTQAVELADEAGLDELTLARVADELGVQASALYNHVDGLDGLRQAVVVRASETLAGSLRDAAVGRAGDEALEAVAHAYRKFAHDHPGQYASTLLPMGPSIDTAPASQATIVDVLARILESYGPVEDRAVHAARIVRSAIHGFVTLEASESFTKPQDTDDSFAELIDFIARGLHDMASADAAS